MRLTRLYMTREEFGAKKGQFTGTAKFAGEAGEVEVQLNPEQCARIFTVCADGVVSVAREVAENLTREATASIAQPVSGKVIG